MAICLVVVSFLMPLFSRELRKTGSIMFGYWFVIFLHQIVAFLNVYLLAIKKRGTFGASDDANQGFHRVAKELALHGATTFRDQELSVPLSLNSLMKGGPFYYEMLGTVYQWFGASLLLGEQLSILAFVLSCIVFLKIMRQLGSERYSFSALICFGALPSMVFLGSITLRESFEVFFFMLTVYLGVRISMKRKFKIGSVLLMAMSAFLMGVFHKALVVYAVFMIFIFLIWSYRPISRLGSIKKLHLMAMIVAPLFFLCIVVVLGENYVAFALIKELQVGASLEQLVMGWRESSLSLQGRTSYDISLNPSSPLTLFFSGLKIYGYYIFGGFSWRFDNFVDAYATVEAILRLILISFSVLGWWKAVGLQKRLLGLMLFLYISMSFMWAMGTTNYGTAMRHHMLTWWITVILGVPPLMATLNRFWSGRMRRYRDSSDKILHG